ncbi:MAG: helix-turn-helix transcriptional regulator [Coleofasciculaceae cyanobacterium SM2_1_6]|nr:helix-turn-helix transcriptional regulator [Coleofasciculaceae cyanobacterium SM2_1_6]
MVAKKYACPVEFTIDRIGGKWKCVILWWLRRGSKRFGELMQLMPEISQKVLTAQLRELEADDLIKRQVFAESPPRVEYSLTANGETLRPILEMMCHWGKANGKEHQFGSAPLRGLQILVIGNALFNQRMAGELGDLQGAKVVTISGITEFGNRGFEDMQNIQNIQNIYPDVVLIDFSFQEDFRQLKMQLKKLEISPKKPIKIIAIITNNQEDDRASAQGINLRLREPIDIPKLVEMIHTPNRGERS